jgi:general secretion pathway protein G
LEQSRGLTFIELLIVVAILMVIATVVIPMAQVAVKRQRELELKRALEQMRNAIDMYKMYADQGFIMQDDVEQEGYPPDLETLVDGVEIGGPENPIPKTIKFLRKIPIDPMTGEEEWGMRSYQDDFDSNSWGGENVYDVYSLSTGQALDETYYKDW